MNYYWHLLILSSFYLLEPTSFAQDHSTMHMEVQVPSKNSTNIEARVPIDVPIEQQNRMGIRLTRAEKKPLEYTLRTIGNVTADQTKEAHVHSKINGWIEEIYADYVGKAITKNQPLFELYSPDLVSTQEEYLAARNQGGAGKEIAQAALERLKLWSVPQSEIDQLVKIGKSKRAFKFSAPMDGYIVNKTAIKGMYIMPEMELYHIADLAKVWVIVTLYEYDISAIKVGDDAEVHLSYDSTKSFSGKINYLYPEVDIATRTAKARIEVSNTKGELKPGMFANVEIKKNLGEAITVPDDAVIDTGLRKIVFIKTGATRFEPREVKIGPHVNGAFAILSGVNAGESVLTSAHFLIDAESKFQSALQKGEITKSGHSDHGK